MIDETGRLVRCESPSKDQDACRRSAALVAELASPYLGAEPETLDVRGATHLRWTMGDPDAWERVLLVGHHDTVWPLGTLERLPWSVTETDAGPVLRGPGCFDMKAGLVVLWHAVAALRDAGTPNVTVLVTGDEEIGSPDSRDLIQAEARRAAAAFVLEASADGGALKSARKGASMYTLEITGRAAHAGLEPERGANAGVELAHQVLRIAALADAARGTSVSPTASTAGTTTNTIPAEARLAVDARAWTLAEQERVDAQLRAIGPTVLGTGVTVSGGINRPPLEDAMSADLLQRARRCHRELGLGELDDVAVGGASDGNFTAGVGTPTLDGLGAVGGGAHADDEHVLARHLPERAALLAALISEVTG
ncbi:M20 family metallopeptidase [Jatrophihabitans fulvus]